MPGLSSKHIQIDKANRMIFGVLAVAVFLTIFCGFSAKALLAKRSFQSRVLKDKETALDQLTANINAVNSLKKSYEDVENQAVNVIGGSATGTGDRDGDNAKIILDALPSQYDFPALTSSLEKILNAQLFKINNITGTDDEVAQSTAAPGSVATPVVMPFSLSVTGSYPAAATLVSTLESSIRPFQVTKLTMSGSDSELQIDISANTYYQPQSSLSITTKVVK